ncbi:hypothetical protein HRbin36_01357 [bacterium HR36]|nr:hypothetical protein HRbin36_01357 [bacterium HR36]
MRYLHNFRNWAPRFDLLTDAGEQPRNPARNGTAHG